LDEKKLTHFQLWTKRFDQLLGSPNLSKKWRGEWPSGYDVRLLNKEHE
jgi:hypothetical protein